MKNNEWSDLGGDNELSRENIVQYGDEPGFQDDWDEYGGEDYEEDWDEDEDEDYEEFGDEWDEFDDDDEYDEFDDDDEFDEARGRRRRVRRKRRKRPTGRRKRKKLSKREMAMRIRTKGPRRKPIGIPKRKKGNTFSTDYSKRYGFTRKGRSVSSYKKWKKGDKVKGIIRGSNLYVGRGLSIPLSKLVGFSSKVKVKQVLKQVSISKMKALAVKIKVKPEVVQEAIADISEEKNIEPMEVKPVEVVEKLAEKGVVSRVLDWWKGLWS